MSSTDYIARGLITQTRTELTSSAEGMGAGKVGFSAAATGSGRTVQEKLRESISVKDYGAAGNGTTDDTVAIQNAINAVIGTSGGSLYFPNGTYRITGKLVIPLSYGWRIHGQSMLGARIRQHTTNTRIFSFETVNTWGWEICEMTLEWNSQQTTANTQAIAIFMGSGTASSTGFYDWHIRRVSFAKGFRGIAGDSANSPALWGVHIVDCNCDGSMAGAFYYASPTPSVGQPNVRIEHCRLSCQGMGEEAIKISSGDSVYLANIELLNGGPTHRLMQLSTCFTVTVINCKSENYNVGAAGGRIFGFSNCNVRVFNTNVNGVQGTAGASYFLFGESGTTMSIIGLTATTSMTGGTLLVYTADTAVPLVADIKLNPTGTGRASDDVFPWSGCAPKFDADKRQRDRINDIGDADAALSASSLAIQYQNVTLTANRAITLPSTGLYEGMSFHIVRRATTPGAFTLQVTDPIGANNYTFASATNGYVKYRARSGAWRIIEAGPL